MYLYVKTSMLPKKKENIETFPIPIGRERVKQLIAGTDLKSLYLPKNISLEDLDTSIFNLLKEEFQLTLDGEIVPLIYMSNERWGEFEKTWQYQDDDKNVLTPLLSLKRTGNPEPGTINGTIYTYAQRRTFKYLDIPTLEDDSIILTRYKIPQAAPVDLDYEFSFFGKYLVDRNKFDEVLIRKFSSRQVYSTYNGNYFPIILETSTNEDDMEDVNGDRLYVSTYTLKLHGYLQDENEFEISKTTKYPKIKFKL